jgi:hypothetical protein
MKDKLTEPQKKALLYYQRAALPIPDRGKLAPPWHSIKQPDPRVKWALTDMGILDRKGFTWTLSEAGVKLAEELWARPVRR